MSLIPKPKIEITKNTSKIELDKYYTPISLAKRLIDKTFEVIGRENITDIIEPSAGSGAFSSQMRCTAYDIEPEADGIIKQDFLRLELPYKKGRLCIGNPPFGSGSLTAIAFYKHACKFCDYIAFILPISALNGRNLKLYQFDLVYSENLGIQKYSDRDLHCCFNIYKRPKGGINPKPDFKLKDVLILEHRRLGKPYDKQQNRPIPDGWFHAMGNWGNGTCGRQITHINTYAQEVFFYCKKPELIPKLKEILSFERIQEYVKCISMKRISVMALYVYIKECLPEIE